MQGQVGGLLWLIIDVGFVVILAIAIAYGTIAWRRRNRSPAAAQARDRATEQIYREEDRRR
jgi:hypothetical protein